MPSGFELCEAHRCMGRWKHRAGRAGGGQANAAPRAYRRLHRACAALASSVLVCTVTVAVHAEENALLTRMLQEGQSFQVRAGAAAVIGQRRDGAHRPELEGALGDTHPTVRAAAASALGRIGSTESLPPLRGASHDRVREVASTAQHAIHTIEEAHTPTDVLAVENSKPRFGLMLGEMVNQSKYVHPEVSHALGAAVQRQLLGVPGVVVVEPGSGVQQHADSGLAVFRLDGAVTTLSTVTTEDGHLSVHCEVALLVVDRPTGSLRTLFKGAARAVEIPKGDLNEQKLDIAQRVVAGAVRSALRNADSALAVAMR
jgi:hypothetical protein